MGGPPAHGDCNGLNHEGHEEHEETINCQSSTINDAGRGFDLVIVAATRPCEVGTTYERVWRQAGLRPQPQYGRAQRRRNAEKTATAPDFAPQRLCASARDLALYVSATCITVPRLSGNDFQSLRHSSADYQRSSAFICGFMLFFIAVT